MSCPPCGRGFHDECDNGLCELCHEDFAVKVRNLGNTGNYESSIKNPDAVTDRQSTGRKRAAVWYPIFKDKPCEWQGKKNCGGGPQPIVGCIKGLQQDRHHGPVKDTLRNEPGNVHRICKFCHNRWHAVNDPIYDETVYNDLPHAPEKADEIELLANEAYWRIK
jgi:hypothetical protein